MAKKLVLLTSTPRPVGEPDDLVLRALLGL